MPSVKSHTHTATVPPGRSTRRNSLAARAGSTTKCSTSWARTASKAPIVERDVLGPPESDVDTRVPSRARVDEGSRRVTRADCARPEPVDQHARQPDVEGRRATRHSRRVGERERQWPGVPAHEGVVSLARGLERRSALGCRRRLRSGSCHPSSPVLVPALDPGEARLRQPGGSRFRVCKRCPGRRGIATGMRFHPRSSRRKDRGWAVVSAVRLQDTIALLEAGHRIVERVRWARAHVRRPDSARSPDSIRSRA